MARTKITPAAAEGAVGAKRLRELELVAHKDAIKAKATKITKRSPKAEAIEESEEVKADAPMEEAEEPAPVAVEEEEVAAEEEEAAVEVAAEPETNGVHDAEAKTDEKAAEGTGETKEKRAYRHKPGRVAEKEVKKQGFSVTPLMTLAGTARVTRHMAHQMSSNVKFQASALTNLRAIAESTTIRVLQEAKLLMVQGRKKRLTDEHVAMAAALRFQRAPGHTSAAYTQLRRNGYDEFNMRQAMNFDYFHDVRAEHRAKASKAARAKQAKLLMDRLNAGAGAAASAEGAAAAAGDE